MRFFIICWIILIITACSTTPVANKCHYQISQEVISSEKSSKIFKPRKLGELSYTYREGVADTISIYNDSQRHIYNNGEEQIISLEPGKYTIEFRKIGYYPCYIDFDLPEKYAVYIEDIELKKAPTSGIPIGYK